MSDRIIKINDGEKCVSQTITVLDECKDKQLCIHDDDWSNLVESNHEESNHEEYNRLGCIKKHAEKNDKSNQLNISECIDTPFGDISDYDLLNKIAILSKNLKFQYARNCSNIKLMNEPKAIILWTKKYVCWLNLAIERIIKNNAFIIKHTESNKIKINKINQIYQIHRNSYRFCDFGAKCKFHYQTISTTLADIIGNNVKSVCHSKHFVFDFVIQDIQWLLHYLNVSHEQLRLDKVFNEIKTSINTITYVLIHMHDEIMNRMHVVSHN